MPSVSASDKQDGVNE